MPSRAASRMQLGGQRIVDHGQNHQDRVGAQRPRFGHLPGIDQELLAQAGQGGRRRARRRDARRRPGSSARRSAPTGRPRRPPRRRGRCAGGSKSARIRPLDGEAFLISAISGQAARRVRPRSRPRESRAAAARPRSRRRRSRPGDGRPARCDLLALVGGDLVEDVAHSCAVRWPSTRPSRAAAAPPRCRSTAPPARPLRAGSRPCRRPGRPRPRSAARCRDRRRARPPAGREAPRRCRPGRRRAGRPAPRAAGRRPPGVMLNRRTPPSRHSATWVVAGRGHLVEAVAVDDPGPVAPSAPSTRASGSTQRASKTPEHLPPRARPDWKAAPGY